MRHLATILVILLLAVPAMSVELFRYRYNGTDGGQYEVVFETDEQSVGKTVDKEKAVEIAMAWMQAFYGERVGTIESQELKTKPVPHWLFRLTVDDPVGENVFCRSPAGRDGCRAESGEAVVIRLKYEQNSILYFTVTYLL